MGSYEPVSLLESRCRAVASAIDCHPAAKLFATKSLMITKFEQSDWLMIVVVCYVPATTAWHVEIDLFAFRRKFFSLVI